MRQGSRQQSTSAASLFPGLQEALTFFKVAHRLTFQTSCLRERLRLSVIDFSVWWGRSTFWQIRLDGTSAFGGKSRAFLSIVPVFGGARYVVENIQVYGDTSFQNSSFLRLLFLERSTAPSTNRACVQHVGY